MTQMVAVDLFAGAGGWTEGADQAGIRVAAAVNHWKTAVDSHAANHPNCLTRCQDLALMDPAELPDFNTLLASPACTGHTRARGKERSYHDASRATAWCVIDVAEARRPDTILIENVTDFRKWTLYRLWFEALQKLGYVCTENVLDAADFGVPRLALELGHDEEPNAILRSTSGPRASSTCQPRASSTSKAAAGRRSGRRAARSRRWSGSPMAGRSTANDS